MDGTDYQRSDSELRQQHRIERGLSDLLVGENKALTIVAALSIATSTAHGIGLARMELQKMLMRMFDRRDKEKQQEYDYSDFTENELFWLKAFRDDPCA